MEGQPSNDGTAGKPLQSIANVMVNFGGFFSGHLSQLIAPFAGLTPTAAGLGQGAVHHGGPTAAPRDARQRQWTGR